jgi:hypothetical protein
MVADLVGGILLRVLINPVGFHHSCSRVEERGSPGRVCLRPVL